MNEINALESAFGPTTGSVWPVGALCRAVAEALEEGFNPVRVAGEISGFSRASSGHCYFSLKDANGQLRCAMFRRAAALLQALPRDGDRVEVRGRLGVYEPRGELQLIVESLEPVGKGNLFEEFLRRKAQLEHEGFFDAARKRPLPAMPRGIGVVTSLGAAALHDVMTALQRRVPHIPVLLVPASVQGEQSPAELVRALQLLYAQIGSAESELLIDTILLVRGGGSMEDLWAFNDEGLARTIALSPVPVISGIGHETDFTISDFVADLRAPTPTAAAELVSDSRQSAIQTLAEMSARLQRGMQRYLDRQAQQLDRASARIGRLHAVTERQHARVQAQALALANGMRLQVQDKEHALSTRQTAAERAVQSSLRWRRSQLEQMQLRLHALDPSKVLARGYAWLATADGAPVTAVDQVRDGQPLRATLKDGQLDLSVLSRQIN